MAHPRASQGRGGKPASGPDGLEVRLTRATAALRKESEKARHRIAQLKGQGSVAYDALWEEVDRVLDGDPPLYLGGGYKTKEAFIAKELPGETLRSVTRNVLVARSFSPRDEAKHGINFLEEVGKYAQELAAAGEVPRAIDLDRLKLKVRGKDGATLTKRVAESTIDEVRKARRALRTRTGLGDRGRSPVEAALRVALRKEKGLDDVAVRAGKTAASFSHVPLTGLVAFGRALTRAKLPAAGEPRR